MLGTQAAVAGQERLGVGPGEQFASISAALAAAAPGSLIEVHGGRYAERIVIEQPVSIVAAPGEAVEVVWESSRPYESTVSCPGMQGPVLLRGLRIRHASKSIANNYAVFLQCTNAVLDDLDISSSTGTGVGVEGGSPKLVRCSVHDCERHGVALFGDIEGSGCGAVVEECHVSANRLDGLLVRDGATPSVKRCDIGGNGGWGLELIDCGGVFASNRIAANSLGTISYNRLVYEEVDTAQLPVLNRLDRPVQYVS